MVDFIGQISDFCKIILFFMNRELNKDVRNKVHTRSLNIGYFEASYGFLAWNKAPQMKRMK